MPRKEGTEAEAEAEAEEGSDDEDEDDDPMRRGMRRLVSVQGPYFEP